MKQYAIQFFGYTPTLYNSFDEFCILIAQKLKKEQIQSIFIFDTKIENPQLQEELQRHDIIIEFLYGHNLFCRIKQLIKIINKYHPLFFHCHFGPIEKVILSIACKLKNIPYFVSFHSLLHKDKKANDYKRNKGLVKFLLMKMQIGILSTFSTSIICVSDYIKEQLLDFYKSSKIKRIYLGIDTSIQPLLKNDIRKNNNIEQTSIAFCNVSAIESLKGIDVILKAMNLIKEIAPAIYKNLHFYHIGGNRVNGEQNLYESELKEYTQQNGLSTNVHFLGKRSDIKSLLFAFDFYVHPSRMEGISLAIMEAGLHKLPVVGSNVGGIPEIVKNDNTGYLISPYSNYKQLAEFIILLAQDEDKRKILGNNIHHLANTNFNISVQAEKYIQEFYHAEK